MIVIYLVMHACISTTPKGLGPVNTLKMFKKPYFYLYTVYDFYQSMDYTKIIDVQTQKTKTCYSVENEWTEKWMDNGWVFICVSK